MVLCGMVLSMQCFFSYDPHSKFILRKRRRFEECKSHSTLEQHRSIIDKSELPPSLGSPTERESGGRSQLKMENKGEVGNEYRLKSH